MNQTPEAKKLTHLEEGETHLWRGDLSPIGCAAVVNPADSVYLTDPRRIVLGLLRRPSGINPSPQGIPQSLEIPQLQGMHVNRSGFGESSLPGDSSC